ncbi:MAG: hypothetical protein ACOC00_04485 [Halothiobacillaceae bacterium]
MLPAWLRPAPLIDEPTRRWMLDVYEWALKSFDGTFFARHTPLVTPTDRDFPGRARAGHERAVLVLDHVCRHAGLAHWPVTLQDPVGTSQPSLVATTGTFTQQPGGVRRIPTPPPARLDYAPGQVTNPEALIGSLARALADLVARTATTTPPGGAENWRQMTEVLAVFMGFGIIMANSAYESPRLGCGACRVPGAERAADLSRYDLTYALAIFCVLKQIRPGAATTHLKSPLRGHLRKAVRQLRKDPDLIRLANSLSAMDHVGEPKENTTSDVDRRASG